MRSLLQLVPGTRLAAVSVLAAFALCAPGCDDDASPTTPAPAPAPAPAPPPAPAPEPDPIQADQVVDRETLQAFVERAAEALSEHAADRETAYAFLDANFRDEGEWRHEDIYVFVLTMEGINFFQAPDPDWEGTDTSDLEDLNGVKLGQGLLEAARAGGGFVEYSWDNPAVEGDEEHGSPKLAYAVPITLGEVPMLLGSGIYVDTSAQ